MTSIIEAVIIILATTSVLTAPSSSAGDDKKKVSFHHTVAPVAVCDDTRLVNPHEKVDECHLTCTQEPKIMGRAKVTFYKDVSDTPGPNAVLCEKIKVSQTFTETWTFAKIKGHVFHEREKIDVKECKEAVEKHCPKLDCDIHPPDELKEEYFYASDHTVSETHLRISFIPTTLYESEGSLSIAFANRPFHLLYSQGSAEDDDYEMLIWDTKASTGGKCPFEPSVTYGCDQWKLQESMNYICSQGRLAFESSGSTPLGTSCYGIRISPEGIMYKAEKAEPDSNYNSQRISMLTSNKFTGDLETLRVVAANGLAHLDSDVCSLECEIANVELRTSRHHPSLVRTGSGYILVTPKGHAYDCSKVIKCSMIRPYKFCGNPPRVNIRCDGRDYFWNPEFSHVMVGNGCPAPRKNETFSIHLGNHLYNLDKDMTVKVPQNYTNSFRTRSYTLVGGSLIKAEDLPDMRNKWAAAKAAVRNSKKLNETKVIDHHSLFSASWIPSFGGIAKYIGGSIRTGERWLIGIVIFAAAVYISKPVVEYITNRNTARVQNRRRADEYQMVFL